MGYGIRMADFSDGTSNTFLVGEKHVPQNKNGVGWWDCSMYDGLYPTCHCRSAGPNYPMTTNPNDQGLKFGGGHVVVVLFVFGDGGVRNIPTHIDPNTLALLAARNDGKVIPEW